MTSGGRRPFTVVARCRILGPALRLVRAHRDARARCRSPDHSLPRRDRWYRCPESDTLAATRPTPPTLTDESAGAERESPMESPHIFPRALIGIVAQRSLRVPKGPWGAIRILHHRRCSRGPIISGIRPLPAAPPAAQCAGRHCLAAHCTPNLVPVFLRVRVSPWNFLALSREYRSALLLVRPDCRRPVRCRAALCSRSASPLRRMLHHELRVSVDLASESVAVHVKA